jgi:hypothetical protein
MAENTIGGLVCLLIVEVWLGVFLILRECRTIKQKLDKFDKGNS